MLGSLLRLAGYLHRKPRAYLNGEQDGSRSFVAAAWAVKGQVLRKLLWGSIACGSPSACVPRAVSLRLCAGAGADRLGGHRGESGHPSSGQKLAIIGLRRSLSHGTVCAQRTLPRAGSFNEGAEPGTGQPSLR